jgi:hypothetical protein
VIPGFQGLTADNRITTLGRGGSDTSAVAVAAALKADRCDIYTDVDGVYTTDPRIVAKARKLKNVTYEEMLELASVGSKVLQTRSVSLAMKEKVRVQVLSSFIDENAPAADTLPGTMIVSDEELEGLDMERQLITGIAADKNDAKVILTAVPDRPGAVSSIFGPLAAANINVDMIIQNVGRADTDTDVTFTVPAADLDRTVAVLEENREVGYQKLSTDPKVAKISVVGVGAQPRRRRGHDVQGAGRSRDQHSGDLDLGNQGLGADRFGRNRTGRAFAAHGLWVGWVSLRLGLPPAGKGTYALAIQLMEAPLRKRGGVFHLGEVASWGERAQQALKIPTPRPTQNAEP